MQQLGIGGQTTACRHFNHIAGLERRQCHLLTLCAIDARGGVRTQRHQRGDATARPRGGIGFQPFSQLEQQQHHGSFGVGANHQRARGGEGHQGFNAER